MKPTTAMVGLYNIALLLVAPLLLLILLSKDRCRRGLSERLGFGRYRRTLPGKVLWVHAVSLGEVIAAVPLIRQLRQRHPASPIVVTTVTETGREAVEQRLAGIAEHRYAPLDFPWVVPRVVRRLEPQVFLCIETELWPNLLTRLSQRNVPVLLVNGRVSSKSFRGYRLIRPFMSQILQHVTYCLMQSERDAERIIALGARRDRVVRSGNIKFDQPVPDADPAGAATTMPWIESGEELIVAGSTHPGEEEQLLACYASLLQEFPRLVLLLAPRHVERAAQLQTVVERHGFQVVRRSRTRDAPTVSRGPRVVLLDTRGELAALYRHAVLAFVGGTLVPVGGHNLLEPAVWGKAVFFGPHTDHCFDIARLLLDAGGGRQVRDGQGLASEMAELLRDRVALAAMGRAAELVLLENRGALARSLDVIARVVSSEPPARRRTAGAVHPAVDL